MPSVFDGSNTSVDSLGTAKANATDATTDHPGHHNDLADAVNKMQRGMPRHRTLAADAAAVVGTALANAGLAFPVEANVVRRFMIYGRWSPDAATTGARFALNGPALTSLVYLMRLNTTATVITQLMGTAYDVAHTVGTAANASSSNIVIVEGLILCSAAGDVQLRSAAEVASPGAVQLRAGSSVLHW